MKKSLILYFMLMDEQAQVEPLDSQTFFDELEWDGYYLDAWKNHETGEKQFDFGSLNNKGGVDHIPLDEKGRHFIELKLDEAWNNHRLEILEEEQAQAEADEEMEYIRKHGMDAYYGVSPYDFFNPKLY